VTKFTRPCRCSLLFLFVILFTADLLLTADQNNIRYHEASLNHPFNYSYINLKRVSDYKLDCHPLHNDYRKKTRQGMFAHSCHGACMSFNVVALSVGVYECEILSTDVYRSKPLDLLLQSNAIHYIIAVSYT